MKIPENDIAVIKKFPDPKTFTEQEWNSKFCNANVIIHSFESNFYYPKHWGLLSVKCAFGGNEYYLKERCKYSVCSENFLILNEGTHYSSYIRSHAEVESLAIIFNSHYKSEVSKVLLETEDKLIDQPFHDSNNDVVFEERLFAYNLPISRFIQAIRELTKDLTENSKSINELLFFLLEELMLNNTEAIKAMNKIDAAKFSTRKEIYRRLNDVKDYIDSCFNEDVTLNDLSAIALMSPFHLLRQFKKNYKITPHQYIMKQRLEHSKKIILNTNNSLTDICFMIGFKDMSSYSRLFKRTYGLSPLQFRNYHQQDGNSV
jgi:AraC-like DNA-binding protein